MCKIKSVLIILNCLLFHQNRVSATDDIWDGKWFPKPPNDNSKNVHELHQILMGVKDVKCDNAEDNLSIDFDPESEIDKLMYTCLDHTGIYESSYNVQPLLREYIIPPKYVPLHKCLNESISYDVRLPTYGSHRPNWPKYGEYKFVPLQRWLHNVEHGSIVMLYHPCANPKEVEKLKMIVKNCLYRYIITPSKRLLPARPLALVAWGKSLEMSAVYPPLAVDFIKSNALKGPEENSKNGQYDKLLIEDAKIISDRNDTVLCPKL